jgi:hypothetical protein
MLWIFNLSLHHQALAVLKLMLDRQQLSKFGINHDGFNRATIAVRAGNPTFRHQSSDCDCGVCHHLCQSARLRRLL